MNCLKCGREVPEGQLFCESCLLEMEKYPVKPNTAIQLPRREERKKAPTKRRQMPSAEERLRIARRTLRQIIVLWLITLVLLLLSLYPAVKYFLGESVRLPGQNYSTFSTAPTETHSIPQPGTTSTSPTTP